MPSANANFCSHCGSALDGDVNYCPQCGTQCRETTPAERADRSAAGATRTASTSASSTGATATDPGAGADADQRAFRRRVDDYLVDGWEVESDRGDRVVVRDPEYGSVPVHVLLLLFTGGIGNLAYGWYKYTRGGERRILRENGEDTLGASREATDDGTPRGDGDAAASVAGYLGGAFSLLMAAVMLSSWNAPIMLLGGVFLVAALWMMPATRRRLANRHPPTTFGRTRSTEETTRVDPDSPCVVCSAAVEEGVERSYREEYVVAGVPLFTTDAGENQYCRSCASGGVSEYLEDAPASDDRTVEYER
jgi:predicted nucleic acid-binding Zn ribbon protein